jgi:hypothetical protein
LSLCAGTYGGARYPSNFLCLVLKLLQIQPADEVVKEYIIQQDSKYLRILGAFYLRLTGKADVVRSSCVVLCQGGCWEALL